MAKKTEISKIEDLLNFYNIKCPRINISGTTYLDYSLCDLDSGNGSLLQVAGKNYLVDPEFKTLCRMTIKPEEVELLNS